MQSKESSRLDLRRYAEVSALVQVSRPELPGYGGQAAPPPGAATIYTTENYPGAGNGNGNGAAPSPPAPGLSPFDPRGAVQIPDNFWGFVMLMMGLKS